MEEIICKQCGKKFMDFPSNKRIYCSNKCRANAMQKQKPLCKVCSKPVKLMRNTYCSRHCRNIDLGFQKRNITSYSGLYNEVKKMYPNPEPCAICGKKGQHRHHPDYSKPFEIIWLCESCHHKIHSNKGKVRIKEIFIPTKER